MAYIFQVYHPVSSSSSHSSGSPPVYGIGKMCSNIDIKYAHLIQ
jgi:hypothetical protein